jgi:hypothetical protein
LKQDNNSFEVTEGWMRFWSDKDVKEKRKKDGVDQPGET